MKILNMQLASTYPIYLGQQILSQAFIEYCKKLTQRLVLITDTNLEADLGARLINLLRAAGMVVELLVMPAGEQYKTRETKQLLEDQLLAKAYGRDTCLIALGGGVVSDVVGFLASTYCRGVPVVYVPTTLLAMVDASIGGKTAVDTPFGKNLIGSFYQPSAVFIDIEVLSSLPEPQFRCGVVEMLKHGLVADAAFFKVLRDGVQGIHHADFLVELIYRSCELKKNIVEQDEREQGVRQVLNFGHTIGHALELLEHYQLSHGEAVALGMVVEAYLSALCGYLDFAMVQEIEDVLRHYGLTLRSAAFNDPARIHAVLSLDKKAVQKVPRFVLLDAIGQVHVESGQYSFAVAPELLTQALVWAARRFGV